MFAGSNTFIFCLSLSRLSAAGLTIPELTPKELALEIKKLKAKSLTLAQYERELVARGIWSANGVW